MGKPSISVDRDLTPGVALCRGSLGDVLAVIPTRKNLGDAPVAPPQGTAEIVLSIEDYGSLIRQSLA